MKLFLITISVLLSFCVLLLCIPFVGPQLGLAGYDASIEPPGEQIALPAGMVNVQDHQHSGRDVVLVHGHPGSAQMMRPLASALHKLGYRVVRYDRMGWGYSAQRPADQPDNPSAHAADLLALTSEMSMQHPLFVGYSYGGGVVMEANLQAPEVVNDFVLISSVGKRRLNTQPSLAGRILNSPLFKRWAFGTDYTINIASAAISNQVMYPEQALPGEFEGFMASLSLPGVPTHWQRENNERYLQFDDYHPELVRGCALILHGADDQVIPQSTAVYLAESVPSATLEIVDGAGHGMVIAQPGRLAESIARHDQTCRRAAP